MKGTSSERVDDVPVVLEWLSQMQIEALINQEVPPPHGNRKGLSYGQLAVLLLSYIITPIKKYPNQTKHLPLY